MMILILGINQVILFGEYTSGYKRNKISKGNFKGQTDVLEREFPIGDVAGGQFGNPLIFPKGNPLS